MKQAGGAQQAGHTQKHTEKKNPFMEIKQVNVSEQQKGGEKDFKRNKPSITETRKKGETV